MIVDVKIKDGIVTLHPNRSIIGVASGQLQQVIENLLQDTPDSPRFLFNFADVPRIDSTGLGVLVALHVSIAPKGGRIGVININPAIHKLFAMVRLTTIFEHFASESEAIDALQR